VHPPDGEEKEHAKGQDGDQGQKDQPQQGYVTING
jgi:hypothetical protein